MQSITTNPLPSPQIFPLNPPPSFIILLLTLLIPTIPNYPTYLPFIPPFIPGLTVYLLSRSTKKITPLKLPLPPIPLHFFFTTLTQPIILLNQHSNSTL
ncbi:iron chelate uptake ABC transporter family permease subunit, partial [Staphylococcus hominis]|uniref:iron chelate uptake ABC transporter family permease subunit n=1 Tax=Staphylococcus hominis TaxID=1290 RepID=UPI0021B5881D